MNISNWFNKSFLKRVMIALGAAAIISGSLKVIKENVSVIDPSVKKSLPIYSVDSGDKKLISLTFDAAWGVEDLDEILLILDRQQVKATFFVTGDWVSKYPDAIKKISANGHDLGNHGDNHKHMSQLGEEANIKEIKGCHDRVKSLLNVEMNLFRPPYGDYNGSLIDTATKCNYYSIQWDIDSLDWKDYGVDSIIDTVVNHKNLQHGSIILMHNGAKYTKDALEAVIKGIKEKGYEFVPVSKLIYKEDYYMDHTGRQIKK